MHPEGRVKERGILSKFEIFRREMNKPSFKDLCKTKIPMGRFRGQLLGVVGDDEYGLAYLELLCARGTRPWKSFKRSLRCYLEHEHERIKALHGD